MQHSLGKATIMDLVENALPEDEPFKIFILATLDEMIPTDELAQYLGELGDRRVKRLLARYKAYCGIDGPVRLGDAIDWFRKNARLIIEAYEQRMGEIESLLDVFGDVDPDQMIEVPGSVIVDIRFNTSLPDLEEGDVPG